MLKKTKIICTLGPSSKDASKIKQLIKAGMNAARLNFSHGSYESFEEMVENIKKAEKECKKEIAIIQDLQGPKIRIGKINGEINLIKGKIIELTKTNLIGNEKIIPLQYKKLVDEAKVGDMIYINDGIIEVKVIKKTKNNLICRIVSGGKLTSNKGINVPAAAISANPLTSKDLLDLKFGFKLGVDFVALSFVRKADDISRLKKIIKKAKQNIQIIAKIERKEAINNIEEIIAEADVIMVARGDLGLEIPAEQVPIEQKRIIKLCNAASKPVIIATQMLSSMVENPSATRAEISDIANGVLDHADALMLSNETAVGKYPVKATLTINKVAIATEKLLKNKILNRQYRTSEEDSPLFNATCLSASNIAKDIRANFIVAITNHGFTAREIAKHRAHIPIIAITPSLETVRKLQIVWGVAHYIVANVSSNNFTEETVKLLKDHKIVKTGDEIVICNSGTNKRDFIATLKI